MLQSLSKHPWWEPFTSLMVSPDSVSVSSSDFEDACCVEVEEEEEEEESADEDSKLLDLEENEIPSPQMPQSESSQSE